MYLLSSLLFIFISLTHSIMLIHSILIIYSLHMCKLTVCLLLKSLRGRWALGVGGAGTVCVALTHRLCGGMPEGTCVYVDLAWSQFDEMRNTDHYYRYYSNKLHGVYICPSPTRVLGFGLQQHTPDNLAHP